jgi:hypothetical protein
MTSNRHENCACAEYYPSDLKVWEIRMNGKNFFCIRCNMLVSSEKWKGGIVKFGNRQKYKEYYECPCCGYRMRKSRRNKKQQVESIQHQVAHPELHYPQALKVLPSKIKLLEENVLVPRIA